MQKQTETEHTPTPWLIEEFKDGIEIVQWEAMPDGSDNPPHAPTRIAEMVPGNGDKADAEFIVRAVNAHEDLLMALYTALPFVEDALDDVAFKPGEVKKRLKVVTDALAKAVPSNGPGRVGTEGKVQS